MGERRKRFTAPEGTTYHRDPSILEVWPEPGKTIVVERALKEGRVQRQSASGVLMRLVRPMGGGAALLGAADPTQRGVLVTLQLMNVSAEELDEAGELVVPDVEAAAASGAMSEWMLSELRLADAAPDQLLNLGSYPLLAEAQKRMETKVSDRATIGPAVDQLVKRIKDLMREAMSKEHERLAMAAACLVMILMGTVMAMRLRDSLPLTIYLWAFFPALATVITIARASNSRTVTARWACCSCGAACWRWRCMRAREFVKLAKH